MNERALRVRSSYPSTPVRPPSSNHTHTSPHPSPLNPHPHTHTHTYIYIHKHAPTLISLSLLPALAHRWGGARPAQSPPLPWLPPCGWQCTRGHHCPRNPGRSSARCPCPHPSPAPPGWVVVVFKMWSWDVGTDLSHCPLWYLWRCSN
jgi:hypothetical protein